jgi:hypothetical protein
LKQCLKSNAFIEVAQEKRRLYALPHKYESVEYYLDCHHPGWHFVSWLPPINLSNKNGKLEAVLIKLFRQFRRCKILASTSELLQMQVLASEHYENVYV